MELTDHQRYRLLSIICALQLAGAVALLFAGQGHWLGISPVFYYPMAVFAALVSIGSARSAEKIRANMRS